MARNRVLINNISIISHLKLSRWQMTFAWNVIFRPVFQHCIRMQHTAVHINKKHLFSVYSCVSPVDWEFKLRGWLHDTCTTFIPGWVQPGSYCGHVFLYMIAARNFIPVGVIRVRVHPGNCIETTWSRTGTTFIPVRVHPR